MTNLTDILGTHDEMLASVRTERASRGRRRPSLFVVLALLIGAAPIASAGTHRKPHARKTDGAWMRGCIHERTGPVGGVSLAEARAICGAELPDDEVEAAKHALALARANARVAKAQAKARKAVEACEQAVVDACVEAALPDGSTDCMDEALRPQFNAVCLAQEGK